MAALQAARFLRFNPNLDLAKSWGLNRAIFYALAKAGAFRPGSHKPPTTFTPRIVEATITGMQPGEADTEKILMYLGPPGPRSEAAYFNVKAGLFQIGDSPQNPKKFDETIHGKMSRRALRIANEYLSHFTDAELLDRRRFFEIYVQVRDLPLEKWRVETFKNGDTQTWETSAAGESLDGDAQANGENQT